MSVYVNLPNGEHAQRVVMAGAETGQGDVPVSSNGILPVEVQSRLASTIQTHSGVLVAATGSNLGSWVDCDGFAELAITLMNDASTGSYIDVQWSHDGTTYHGADYGIVNGTPQRKSASIPVKARYVRFLVGNSDAAPHTLSAWAYLKN